MSCCVVMEGDREVVRFKPFSGRKIEDFPDHRLKFDALLDGIAAGDDKTLLEWKEEDGKAGRPVWEGEQDPTDEEKAELLARQTLWDSSTISSSRRL